MEWEVRGRQKEREIREMGVRSKREGVLRYGRMKKTEGKVRRKEREEAGVGKQGMGDQKTKCSGMLFLPL